MSGDVKVCVCVCVPRVPLGAHCTLLGAAVYASFECTRPVRAFVPIHITDVYILTKLNDSNSTDVNRS